jgi:hypothetical protein
MDVHLFSGVPEILEGDQLCRVFKDVQPTFDECQEKIDIKVQKFPLQNSLIHACIWEITA